MPPVWLYGSRCAYLLGPRTYWRTLSVSTFWASVDHLADPLRGEVRAHGVAGRAKDARQLGQHVGARQLGAQGQEDLLLATGTGEVAVADALAGTHVRERRLAIELVLAGTEA